MNRIDTVIATIKAAVNPLFMVLFSILCSPSRNDLKDN